MKDYMWIDGAYNPSNKTGAIAFSMVIDDYRSKKAIFLESCPSAPFAEYEALYQGVQFALAEWKKFPFRELIIYSDSLLVVNQINNRWQVSGGKYYQAFKRAYFLVQTVDKFSISLVWIPEKSNKLTHNMAKGKLFREAR